MKCVYGSFGHHASRGAYGIDNRFAILMSPAMGGVRQGGISYKAEGEVGSRVLTVQFEKCYVNEPNVATPSRGAFSLQIPASTRPTAKIEMAFHEEINLWSNNALFVGLRGWNLHDQIAVRSDGLDAESSAFVSKPVDMTDADTHVRWMSNDNGDVTDMNYTFTPADNLPNTSKAPQGLDRGSIRTRPEYLLQKGRRRRRNL